MAVKRDWSLLGNESFVEELWPGQEEENQEQASIQWEIDMFFYEFSTKKIFNN